MEQSDRGGGTELALGPNKFIKFNLNSFFVPLALAVWSVDHVVLAIVSYLMKFFTASNSW